MLLFRTNLHFQISYIVDTGKNHALKCEIPAILPLDILIAQHAEKSEHHPIIRHPVRFVNYEDDCFLTVPAEICDFIAQVT